MTGHEALNPIHPSVLPHLDPVFIDLYNTHVANTPNKPIDLGILRSKYSVLYSYGTGPSPEPEKVYDAEVPGLNGDMIPVRVYNPNSEGPWPVHVDFHGGGGFIAFLPFLSSNTYANGYGQAGALATSTPNLTYANISPSRVMSA